jgi:hypothetical protein
MVDSKSARKRDDGASNGQRRNPPQGQTVDEAEPSHSRQSHAQQPSHQHCGGGLMAVFEAKLLVHVAALIGNQCFLAPSAMRESLKARK